MADFYVVSSIINTIWQIFTMFFLLYKFTSFFNVMFEFIKFLGKFLKTFIYVKNQIVIYITKRNNYSFDDDIDLPIRPKSYFNILKENCKKLYNNIFGITNISTPLPLYETRTSIINDNYNYNHDNNTNNDKLSFSTQTDDFIYGSNLDLSSDGFYDINKKTYTAIYPPPLIKEPRESQQSQLEPQLESEAKPFNVKDSFMLLRSEFINNMIGNSHSENENEHGYEALNENENYYENENTLYMESNI